MNVNFPDREPDDVVEVEATFQTFRDQNIAYTEQRTDLRGQTYFWIGFRGQRSNPAPGSDLRALYEGRISVTPLHVDLTHKETLYDLKAVLGGAPPVRV
jgi:5'-nucleotidase